MTVRWFVMFVAAAAAVSTVIAQDFPQVRTLSSSIAESMKQSGRKTVAVVDFTDLEGSVTALGRFFAEEFSVALASTKTGIETINRSHLRAILAEHKLSASGLIDPQTARKLGQIAGVDTLLAGTLTPFGETVRLSLQLIDATSARVVSASTADIPRTKAIDELLGRTVVSATTPAVVSASNSPLPAARSQTITAAGGGFEFELRRCRSLGGDVVCEFQVTSMVGDRNLGMFTDRDEHNYGSHKASRIVDSAGTQYPANHYTLARYSGAYYDRSPLLSQGVGVASTVTFKDAGQLASIQVLEISCNGGTDTDLRSFVVRFNNVPVSRR